MKKLIPALFSLVFLPLSHASASNEKLVVKQSAHSVSVTVDKLKAALEGKGITIFARIDHAAGAKKIGKSLKPTQLLIFGNPKLGTPLMQSNAKIGLDLPLKALAWEDKDGQVWLSYTSPKYLKAKYAISDKDPVFKKISGALDNFTNIATK